MLLSAAGNRGCGLLQSGHGPAHATKRGLVSVSGAATYIRDSICVPGTLGRLVATTCAGHRQQQQQHTTYLLHPTPKSPQIMLCGLPGVVVPGEEGFGTPVCIRWQPGSSCMCLLSPPQHDDGGGGSVSSSSLGGCFRRVNRLDCLFSPPAPSPPTLSYSCSWWCRCVLLYLTSACPPGVSTHCCAVAMREAPAQCRRANVQSAHAQATATSICS